MNLQYIWKNQKIIALLLCSYFVLFIGLNVKQGIVATPVLQYGMFSGKQTLGDTTTAYILQVNNVKIALSKYSFTERDILLSSLNKYLNYKTTNEGVYNSFSSVLQKAKINISSSSNKFICNVSDSIFKNWYTQKLENILQVKVKTAEVYTQKIYWKDYKVFQTDTLKKILNIAN